MIALVKTVRIGLNDEQHEAASKVKGDKTWSEVLWIGLEHILVAEEEEGMSGEHPLPPGWKLPCPLCGAIANPAPPPDDMQPHRQVCPYCESGVSDETWFGHRECPKCGAIANPAPPPDDKVISE